MWFQIGFIRSNKILEPAAGAFGSNKDDGFSRSVFLATMYAGTTALRNAKNKAVTVTNG